MNFQEVFLAIISVISALVILVIVVSIGWYLVWKLFLSRFKFVRELLGQMNDSTKSLNNSEIEKKSTKTKKLRKD